MARVDYFAIEEAIETLLKNDETLEGVSIQVEEELSFQRGDIVIIQLDHRDAPADQQSLSRGQRTRMELVLSIWCYHFGLEVRSASKGRDDLIGRVEVALMKNRELGGLVDSSWLDGGRFQTVNTTDGMLIGGEIIWRAGVIATTN